MSKAPDCGTEMQIEYPELSEQLPLWRIMAAMSKEQMQELKELIEDERQKAWKEAWNAAVEQIAEGLELEIDDRTARANRIRLLKDFKVKWP
jgi:hypothetical protein